MPLFWPEWDSGPWQGKESGDRLWRSTIVARADFLMKPAMANVAGAPTPNDGNQTRSGSWSAQANFDVAMIGDRINGKHGLSATRYWTLL